MILTLTANPSLDRTIDLAGALARGAVQRARGVTEQPGGKGVNVSRALIASGLDTIALLPGRLDDPMLVALQAERIPLDHLDIHGRVRQNVTLTEPDGTTTKVNEPGPVLSAAEADALVALVVRHARAATWLVLAGSLPPGLDDDFPARVVQAVRAELGDRAPRIAVDSSGAPMAALVASDAVVDLVKPNGEELAELLGLDDPDALEQDPRLAHEASRSLVSRGCRAVLATLGARGAVLTTADGGWHATMPPIVPVSTVGAGDSSLAGYLLADHRGAGPEGRLRQAVAHGSAAASLPGSTMPSPDQTRPDSVTVQPLLPIAADR
ncbi:1-phosphofructokinase family hexose kinase [Clavibacter tessellarius]|uniref:1-phosphofructokinase n=1 Tax=Clavibacter tessellarius TaxID=31965 RepID=A0A225CR38_9MICO|nr:1-phosphofructokinase family hexose kinase [Clavibacter michiganensis]OQJ63874.1 1-phosphofructokinase [Clavibacter michiganensis subsp. tessellarius]UKF33148.1 1-phosphofructokinase family hexose kinase [Clavibacter michiganensis subsp. tessellarius]